MKKIITITLIILTYFLYNVLSEDFEICKITHPKTDKDFYFAKWKGYNQNYFYVSESKITSGLFNYPKYDSISTYCINTINDEICYTFDEQYLIIYNNFNNNLLWDTLNSIRTVHYAPLKNGDLSNYFVCENIKNGFSTKDLFQ